MAVAYLIRICNVKSRRIEQKCALKYIYERAPVTVTCGYQMTPTLCNCTKSFEFTTFGKGWNIDFRFFTHEIGRTILNSIKFR